MPVHRVARYLWLSSLFVLVPSPMRLLLTTVLFSAALAAAPMPAQAQTAAGAEFLVNTWTTGDQQPGQVGIDASGNYVAVWHSSNQTGGSGVDIYAQRFGSTGARVGSEFRVNTTTSSTQFLPTIAMNAAGAHVVAWTSTAQDDPGAASGFGVFAQRYNASGVAQGSEFQVNTYTTGSQRWQQTAMDTNGNFVVVWSGPGTGDDANTNGGIFYKKYNSFGTVTIAETMVNTYTTGTQQYPSVAMDTAGNYVVVWQSEGQDGSGAGVYGQRYNSAGTKQGSAFKVNTTTAGEQSFPFVAMNNTTGFVVTWQSAAQDGSGFGIYGQRYNTAGTAQGSEFRVNTTRAYDQWNPYVSMASSGNFIVSWQNNLQPTGTFPANNDIYAQRYTSAGVGIGEEFRLNPTTFNDQINPATAINAAGTSLVAVWQSELQDGSGRGVYGQRYTDVFTGSPQQTQTSVVLNGARGFRMLASPTAGATVSDVLGPIWTQGFPGADFEGGGPSVYRYDETAAGTADDGYVVPSSASETMGSGRGYFVNVYADPDLGGPIPPGFPQTLAVTGAGPAGPVALPVTYTDHGDPDSDGWNLVGNPYRESIDWDLVTRADVGSAIYVYDPSLPAYRVWASGIGDIPDGVVAPFQGFWVQAMETNGTAGVAPSVVVPTSALVGGASPFYGRPGEGSEAPSEEASVPVVAFRLTRGDGGYGREASAFVAFVDGATAGLDPWDAYALAPAATDYASLSTAGPDGTALAIQALPLTAERHVVALDASAVEAGAPAGGAFALAWDSAVLPSGWTARLLDAETGASVDLTAAGTYAFEAAAPAGRSVEAPAAEVGPPALVALRSSGSARFTVVVEAQAVGTEDGTAAVLALGVSPNPVSAGGVVRVSVPEAGPVRVVVYDVLGRQVAVLADGERAAGSHDVALAAERLAPGVYAVRVTAGEASIVRRVTVAR